MAQVFSAQEANEAGLLAGSACAFGVFDGVHKGHCYVIGKAVEAARSASRKCVVLTFDVDPDEVFRSGGLSKLMSNEARINALAELDVDAVVVFPFTREFASQEPEAFLCNSFEGGVPSSLHVGRDFRFGSKASGGLPQLESWGAGKGMNVSGYDLLEEDGAPITATRIRHLLAEGKIKEANVLLGRRYSVSAVVQQGRGEGGDFGFKTANLHIPSSLHVLGEGVYAAYAFVDGARYKAAVSNGVSPTFADEARANVECHILDFEGDLYGREITVEFAHWLRPMMTFPNIDELISTVMGNIAWVRENL